MKLALGTVQFGKTYGIANTRGQVNAKEVQAILELARIKGVDTLDTAISYGESEACLGQCGVNNFKVVTKLPDIPENIVNVNAWVHEQVNASLIRLKQKSLYGLLMHRSQQLIDPFLKSLVDSLEDLKAEGLVEKIGVSVYSPSELEDVMKFCSIDMVQAPFNLVDQRLSTSGWLKNLYSAGIEIHIRSVFLQGLLLMSRSKIPSKFQTWSQLWDEWHRWLKSHSISPVQACISFLQAFPQIDRVIVGVESPQQLSQILDAASNPMNVLWPDISSADENLINPYNWSSI